MSGSGIWNLNALCRCCHADGAFKSLQAPYVHDGAIEIYAVLLRDTFGIHINPPTVEASYAICGCCIDQLRRAHCFKKQVLACERKFEEYCKNEQTALTSVNVKIEIENDNDNINPDVDDDDHNDVGDSDGGYGDNDSEIEEPEIVFCEICHKKFEDVQSKRSHLLEAHVADGLSCKLCKKTFENRNALEAHSKTHEKKIWHCRFCVEVFVSKNARDDHEYHQHIKLNGYGCDQCRMSFDARDRLIKHIGWHRQANEFVCHTCGKGFKKAHPLKVHIETVHQNQRSFQCSQCGKAYKSKAALIAHNYSHTGERPFKCPVCPKGFKKRNDLTYHMDRHELKGEVEGKVGGGVGWNLGGDDDCDDDGDDVADDSDGGFDNVGLVNESEIEIEIEEEKGIEIEIKPEKESKSCARAVIDANTVKVKNEVCAEESPDDDGDHTYEDYNNEFQDEIEEYKDGKNYEVKIKEETKKGVKSKTNIVTKERVKRSSHKSDVPTYTCDFCNDQLPSKFHLQDHYTDQHVPDDFSCTLCNLPFGGRNGLIQHLMLKHERKTFFCRYCVETFISSNDLNEHENSHTNDEYICDYCRKVFKWKLTLQRHVNYHMGNFKEFACETCGRAFRVKANLRRHVEAVHHKVRPFPCDECERSFVLKKDLVSHKRFHTGERPFKCDVCTKGFVSECLMKKHRLKHKDVRSKEGVQCDICGKYYPSYAMKQHMDSHTKPYKCELCGIGYGQKANLMRHKQSVHLAGEVVQNDTFTCDVCGEGFNQRAALIRHKKNTHTAGLAQRKIKPKASVTKERAQSERRRRKTPKYTCDFCDEQLASKNILQEHFSNEHVPDDFSCTLCRLPFAGRTDLIKHLLSKHEKKSYYCQYCVENFKSLNALNNHENSHTKSGYACDYCQKVFKWKTTLRRHINWHMGNFKEFACETCGHSFKLAINLRRHIEAVHEKLRPFHCDLCDKAYSTKRLLDTHKRRHTGEKPFACDVCSKPFVNKSNMLAHRQRLHGEKERVCDVCGKQFASSSGLVQHMHTHTKPFNCQRCGEGFSDNAALMRHKTNKHPPGHEQTTLNSKRNLTCDICNKTYLNWELHQRMHDKKPFKCQLCDKFYAEKITLDRHMNLVHYKVRKHSCDICNKMFTRPECVRLHKERKHNRDRQKMKKERKNKSKVTKLNTNKNEECPTVKVEAMEFDGNFDSVVPAYEIPKVGFTDDANVVPAAGNSVLGI